MSRLLLLALLLAGCREPFTYVARTCWVSGGFDLTAPQERRIAAVNFMRSCGAGMLSDGASEPWLTCRCLTSKSRRPYGDIGGPRALPPGEEGDRRGGPRQARQDDLLLEGQQGEGERPGGDCVATKGNGDCANSRREFLGSLGPSLTRTGTILPLRPLLFKRATSR